MLPIGVRRRQLSARTLLIGMCLSAAAEVKAQNALSAASATRAWLPSSWPMRRLASASSGITTSAAAVTTIPAVGCSGRCRLASLVTPPTLARFKLRL